MKLRYTSRAYTDLESILSYLAKQSPEGARSVLSLITMRPINWRRNRTPAKRQAALAFTYVW